MRFKKGKRNSQRPKLVLPIRIAGTDSSGEQFDKVACTLDVSGTGARLAGVRRVLTANSFIDLYRHDRKVRCRIVWVTPVPEHTGEFQVGLACIEEAKDIWEVVFDADFVDIYDPDLLPPFQRAGPKAQEQVAKYRIEGTAEVTHATSSAPILLLSLKLR